MKMKIRKDVWLWTAMIYVFAFQRVLTEHWTVFNYADELFAIGIIVVLFLKAFCGSLRLNKEERIVLFCWCAICLIGLLSSALSKLQTGVFLICIDALSMVKVWLAYYSIIVTKRRAVFYDRLIVSMARWGRFITFVMMICLMVSQFVDIGMMNLQPVYGIIPFRFVFSNPGNFSKLFYFLIPVFTADLSYGVTKYKIFMIGMALLVWASTMRSRALAFIAMYVVIMIYFFVWNNGQKKRSNERRIKKRHILGLGILALAIGWDKLYFYFTTATQARAMLLRYGIITMLNYFPLGAGFGTFGSDVAATHYSPLYRLYGFTNYGGMSPEATNYLNDNYWPMIMGQFGIVGLLLAVGALYVFTKRVFKDTQGNKCIFCASFVAMGCLIISSIASKSYCEYSSICIFLLIGILVKRERSIAA